jgi:hypothetical protein
MSDRTESLLARTGQRWMVLWGIYGFGTSVILMFAVGPVFARFLGDFLPSVFLGCAVAAVLFIALALLFVRCPRCGLQWVAWSMSNRRLGTETPRTMPWLLTFTSCPRCGLTSKEVR